MQNPENPHAGQGPVLLDIGGDVGALVVAMPADSEGLEVEIRPDGTTAAAAARRRSQDPDDHAHTHDHGGDHPHTHHHGTTHHPHVGVVARPGVNGPAHTLVYPAVTEGLYELVAIPGEHVAMTAQVKGGVVTYTSWPGNSPIE